LREAIFTNNMVVASGCDWLALLTFVLGAGAGSAITYARGAIQMAKLHRKIEKLQLAANSTPAASIIPVTKPTS
jgi:hypothetical protein